MHPTSRLLPKCLSTVLRFSTAIVVLFFCDYGLAQGGCDLGILDYTVTCDTAPHGVVNASSCSNFGSGGGPCLFCSQSAGVCVAKNKTHIPYYLANEISQDTCASCAGCCNGSVDCSKLGNGGSCNYNTCGCTAVTPVLIDTTGHGFHLTSAENGGLFDIFGDKHPIKISWTSASSGNAFLALDRNNDGVIDSGKELFGNVTEQPKSPNPNGFLALAEFDKPENGGNGDRVIDKSDSVFSHLLLWIDENHDGISQLNELHALPELGVYSIGLRYRNDRSLFDQYGNWFHYQTPVNPRSSDGESKDGHVAYDVFLVPAKDQSPWPALGL